MKPAPMLAKPLQGEPKRGSVFEPKLDGIRCIVHKEDGVISIYTRTFHEQKGKFPALEKAFAKVPFDFTLDGEICDVQNYVQIEGKSVPVVSFSGAQSVVGSGKQRAASRSGGITFVVFDCLNTQGKDLTNLPDFVRRGAAELMVDLIQANGTKAITLIPRWTGDVDYTSLMEQVVSNGGEGLMVKDPKAAYRTGPKPVRSDAWMKIKDIDTADVVIMGYKPGTNGFSGMVGAVEFGQYRGGKLVARSRCSGMDMKMRKEFTTNGDAYIGQVMEIKYFGRVGPEKSFRHPNFVTIRHDKLPEDCTWE